MENNDLQNDDIFAAADNIYPEEAKEENEEVLDHDGYPDEDYKTVDVYDNLAVEKKEKKKKAGKGLIIAAVMVAVIAIIAISVTLADKDTQDEASDDVSIVFDEEDGDYEGDELYIEEPSYMVTPDNVDDLIVSIGAYKGVKVEVEREYTTDEEVDEYARYWYSSYAEAMEGRVAESGDIVLMDYVGTIDGVAFDGGTAEDAELELGSNSFIDGFEDGLIGVVAGEERVLNLKFPDTYWNTDYAGKDCVFTVTVNGVIPGFSEEGVAAIDSEDFTNMDEYLEYVRSELNDYYQSEYESTLIYTILDTTISESEYKEFPEELLQAERDLVDDTYSDYASYYGYSTTEEYITAMGASMDDIANSYARQSIAFVKIAKEEGLYPTREEILAKYEEEAISYGFESAEELVEIAGEDMLAEEIMIENVYAFLLENNPQ